MAKRGRIPKQKDKLQGHRDNSLSVIQGGKQFDTPKPISRWLTKTRKYWNEYWDSDLAQTAQKVDFPAFYRLFQFYDEVERANRTIQNMGNGGLIDVGSKGQPVVNPLIILTLKGSLSFNILFMTLDMYNSPFCKLLLSITLLQYSSNNLPELKA